MRKFLLKKLPVTYLAIYVDTMQLVNLLIKACIYLTGGIIPPVLDKILTPCFV